MLPHNASTVREWVEEELLAALAWGWMGRWLKREKEGKCFYDKMDLFLCWRRGDSQDKMTVPRSAMVTQIIRATVRALNCD